MVPAAAFLPVLTQPPIVIVFPTCTATLFWYSFLSILVRVAYAFG